MLNMTKWQVFYGPNLLSENPICVAALNWERRMGESEIESACALLRSHWPAFFSEDNWQSSPPEEALGSTIAKWTLGALNELRGCIPGCGYELPDYGQNSEGLIVWVGFHHPSVSKVAMRLSLRALRATMQPGEFNPERINRELGDLWKLCKRYHPDYQATILMQGARAKGIPVLPFMAETKYWQYGWGKKSRIYMESLSNEDGYLSGVITRNKQTTKTALSSIGMPVPPSRLVSAEEDLGDAVDKVGWPCVTKPLNMGGGKGVTAGMWNMEELIRGFHHAKKFTSGAVLLEAFVAGEDHRLMVVRGELIAVIKRVPASIEGNGVDSLEHLIKEKNRHRSLNMPRSNYLRLINTDQILVQHLETQGLSLNSVVPTGKQVFLRSNANLSTGGSCIDLTAEVHPEIRNMAEQIAVTLGLDNAGFDYMTTDISASPQEVKGAFIEANTTPGLDATIAAGWPSEKIASLVLGDDCGRIPVELIVADRTAIPEIKGQLISNWLQPGRALVCGGEAWVANVKLGQPNKRPWNLVRRALRNRSVEFLKVVCDVDQILTCGLPVDKMAKITCDSVVFPKRWQVVLRRESTVLEELAN